MVPQRTKLLDNHIILFVMMLQIIFSQILITTGLPKIDNTKTKLCPEEIVNSQQSITLNSLSINATIQEAYHNCNDKLENFYKIINFIEKQSTKEVKEAASTVLYQEVLNQYKLENLETTQMNLCLLEILLEKQEEAIGHFEGLNPNSAYQVIEYANDFERGIHLRALLKFIALKPEISNVEHNIIIISTLVANKKGMHPGFAIGIGIKLLEIGAKLHSTKIESLYLNKLQELWGNIMVAHCNAVQFEPVMYTKLQDVPSHLHKKEDIFEKVVKYYQDIFIPSVRKVLNKDGVENKFDMILKCVPNSIPLIESGAVLYSTIFDEVAKQNLSDTNNFKTKLADYIKNYMKLPNYSHIDKKYKDLFENLKKKMQNNE